MPSFDDLIARVRSAHELSAEDISVAARALVDPTVSETSKADFLRALALKGETAEEVAAFAKEFRARSIDPGLQDWAAESIDVVGTGGDHAGGFNVSTMVVLTLASMGVRVMKHGNRGITSKCGSADLFAALGVNLEAPPPKLRGAMEQLGFVFFFAPNYHPSFKIIGPVRKALAAEGQRTIFNILAPTINPGRPAQSLVGVFSRPWVRKLAAALDQIGVHAGIAAHGEIDAKGGIDEITTATPNHVRGFGRLRRVDETWSAAQYGFETSPFADLQGADLATNLALVDSILAGRAPRGLVDTIVLNTAIGLWIMGRTENVREGVAVSREHLLGGAVAKKIAATREFYAA
jgi:anthranilate phosphoribosyltransferase